MPPRVTYWTGIWEPHREAISSEVETLRQALQPRAPVVSFSSGQRSSRRIHSRVVRLSGQRWLLLRGLAGILERCGDVTHAFGSLGEWHLLRSLGRRPMLFTVVADGALTDRPLRDKVTMFAVEAEPLKTALIRAGIAPERITVVYPGVDLARFQATPLPPEPFRVLFASTPANSAEFEARGIPLLVEVARIRPDIQMVLRWRRWGDPAAAATRLAALSPPPNVVVEPEAHDMSAVYRGVHATISCYAAGFGKACPNSIIEGLASGRPSIVTDTCGIAGLIARRHAGVAVDRSVTGLAHGIGAVRSDLPGYSRRARMLAEEAFDQHRFRLAYKYLYQELSSS